MIRPARRPAAVVACLLVPVLLLAACAVPPKNQVALEDVGKSGGGAGGGTAAASGAPDGFEDFYTQAVEWSECGGFQCATVDAPLDWQDPGAGTIEIAMKKLPATTDEPRGSLLVNPGGPGASGIGLVESTSTFGFRLRAEYDIVGFDPRGVGQSTPVTCVDDEAKDEFLTTDYPDTDEGIAQQIEAIRQWGQACAENTGELLGNVDTQSAARDMDMLRAALGDEKLNYLGYSYGTQLGATYAGLFPGNAGRLVLDGAIDITLTSDEVAAEQAVGFENALRAYVEDCIAGPECPLGDTVDVGLQQIRSMVNDAAAHPIATSSGRVVTKKLAFYGVAMPLYNEANWSYLTTALQEIFWEGRGDTLLLLADNYNDRNPDGSFNSNSEEAFRAINCADGRATEDLEEMKKLAAEIVEDAPTLGESFGFSGVDCADWPYPAVKQDFDIHAKGAAPIMVIGTTNDPATPYRWSEALADTLDSGFLVTYQGEGHTAYGRSNECVNGAVEDYLVNGSVPDGELTC
ncbi:alpha/beta hydrolase [Myceligenerans xiligouense]|uniref:Alpha/beta hydrolase family protein n=1 Tax=Myceligenerans xiligouense TaxID=253184 RepID=A0A3N4YPY7_9MICO|nr:alpha/beta hydrolase [Myceligenerans xiligouense]RPF23119.1 alpha/beta hydrolase family protein [Myceligenerans xiligouense]